MKKMNSTSKRKWILGGTLGFCSVALLTTGFATWIIGVNQTKAPGDTTVTVDTTKNESAVLEITVDETDKSIRLAETEITTDNKYINSDTKDGDFTIKLKTVKFTYGKGFLKEGESIKSIDFTIPTEKVTDVETDFTANLINQTDKNQSGLRTEGSSWTYVEAPAAITENLTPAPKGELFEISLTNVTLTFNWGSYFKATTGNVSPVNFYNEKLEAKGSVGITVLDNVDTELKAMHEALDGKTLHLLAEVKTGTN